MLRQLLTLATWDDNPIVCCQSSVFMYEKKVGFRCVVCDRKQDVAVGNRRIASATEDQITAAKWRRIGGRVGA